MRGFFRAWKRRRTVAIHVEKLTREDIVVAHAWGLTIMQWLALTDHDRRECRRLITTAPRFEEAAA